MYIFSVHFKVTRKYYNVSRFSYHLTYCNSFVNGLGIKRRSTAEWLVACHKEWYKFLLYYAFRVKAHLFLHYVKKPILHPTSLSRFCKKLRMVRNIMPEKLGIMLFSVTRKITALCLDHGSSFVAYGNEIESKAVQFPGRDALIKSVGAGNRQSPPITRKFVALYRRNTKVWMRLCSNSSIMLDRSWLNLIPFSLPAERKIFYKPETQYVIVSITNLQEIYDE